MAKAAREQKNARECSADDWPNRSPPSMSKREAIRHSPKVRAASWHFWATFGKTDQNDTISESQYGLVHRLIARALAPELTDDEAAEAAHDDWVEDLAGRTLGPK